jgi:predicted AlkP superfamily phosphohydrolase/phosphomutase
MATGLVGKSRSVEGLFEGATWPSFYTGLNPAGHGYHWLDQLRPGSYRLQEYRPADFARSKALWETLSDAGRRVVVLDVPLAPRSPDLNGVQLVEWGCHDSIMGYQSRPRSLGRNILRRYGPHPAPQPCDAPARSADEYRALADQLVSGAAAKARLTIELLAQTQWDFAIQVFSESHCGGHQFWHLHDPTPPGFDPALTERCGDPLRRTYQAIDAAIGSILEQVPAETTVVLLDLHGMAVPHSANLLLPEILTRLGAMQRPPLDAAGSGVLPGSRAGRALRSAYHRVPEAIRRPLYHARDRLNQQLGRGSPINVDWTRSRCFDVPIGSALGAVRLNLKGREPAGMLAPGAEADRFCDRLGEQLREITRPDNGQHWVRRVMRTAELHPGIHSPELPDLLIEWNPLQRVGSSVAGAGAGAVLRAQSPAIGFAEILNSSCRTGQHEPDGLFVVRGQGFGPGSLERTISILDLAPTLARWLGCELPRMDGSPIAELL